MNPLVLIGYAATWVVMLCRRLVNDRALLRVVVCAQVLFLAGMAYTGIVRNLL